MQEKNIGAGEAANGLFDNLRYTYTLPEGSYGAAVREATEDLIARGYQPKRLKNFWANEDGYTAVQGVFETAEGVPFELQFHTERTLYTKEKISHPLYEKVRVLDEFEDSAEIIRLNRAIDEAWKAIRADPPALDGITEAVARVKK